MAEHVQAQTPPMEISEEAKSKHLDLARKQGDSYHQALQEMTQQEAEVGGEVPVGEYVVAIAVEKAEGLWMPKDGRLEWQEPTKENAHIEVSVRDAADNRFIPGLSVYVTVLDDRGNEVGAHRQPFLWHPWLYHYGRNWELPGDGTYTIRVRIDMPEFPRHDKKNGNRYAAQVEATFENVWVTTGQK